MKGTRIMNRRYTPGRWKTLDDPLLTVASAAPSIDEVIQLLQRWLVTNNPEGVPAGLMELSPTSLVGWLKQQIETARSENGDLGERNLNSVGITPVKNVTDAEVELMHSSTLADRRRLDVAKSVAKRRGVSLADALIAVPK